MHDTLCLQHSPAALNNNNKMAQAEYSLPCLDTTLTKVSISQHRNKSDNWLQVEKAKLWILNLRCPLIDV